MPGDGRCPPGSAILPAWGSLSWLTAFCCDIYFPLRSSISDGTQPVGKNNLPAVSIIDMKGFVFDSDDKIASCRQTVLYAFYGSIHQYSLVGYFCAEGFSKSLCHSNNLSNNERIFQSQNLYQHVLSWQYFHKMTAYFFSTVDNLVYRSICRSLQTYAIWLSY